MALKKILGLRYLVKRAPAPWRHPTIREKHDIQCMPYYRELLLINTIEKSNFLKPIINSQIILFSLLYASVVLPFVILDS